jgi:hypothetical protein
VCRPPYARHRDLNDFREEPSTSIRPAALAQRGVDSFLEPAQLHLGYRENDRFLGLELRTAAAVVAT